jgi:23S rRNA (pseudouridine1915-N3)-methyltransferase
VRIFIIKGCKPSVNGYEELADLYLERTRRFARVDRVELKAKSQPLDIDDLPSKLTDKATNVQILFDERGTAIKTTAMAEMLRQFRDSGSTKSVTFLIGGPYGVSDAVRKSSDHVWSLGNLTLPGDLAWLVAIEQLYRCMDLLHGGSYHHA